MRNTLFPTFSSFCSSGGNEEVHMPMAPNLSVDLHRLHNIGTGFYVDPHACNDLHLGSFTPLSSTQEYVTQTIDVMPEGGNGCKTSSMYKEHQKIPTMMSPDQDTTRNTRKRANAAEATLMAASKKKGLYAEGGHQHSQESSTSSVPPMKAPMRRSHKLGDRITALQQLVSPFGKTDTASVLQEATVYIKLLQEQVQVLSNPYFRFRASLHPQGILGEDKSDLRSKGLCLVPVSTTANLPQDAANSNTCPSTGPNTHVCL